MTQWNDVDNNYNLAKTLFLVDLMSLVNLKVVLDFYRVCGVMIKNFSVKRPTKIYFNRLNQARFFGTLYKISWRFDRHSKWFSICV